MKKLINMFLVMLIITGIYVGFFVDRYEEEQHIIHIKTASELAEKQLGINTEFSEGDRCFLRKEVKPDGTFKYYLVLTDAAIDTIAEDGGKTPIKDLLGLIEY